MRKLLYASLLLIIVLLGSQPAAAQTKKRIGLAEGTDSVQVKGKIIGKQYALYEIQAEKGDVWDVNLRSANKYIGFTVKAPNGNRYDFLESSPVSGYYLIRVDLNSRGSKSKKAAEFVLDIKFEMPPR